MAFQSSPVETVNDELVLRVGACLSRIDPLIQRMKVSTKRELAFLLAPRNTDLA